VSCILTADYNITEDSPGVLYPVALTAMHFTSHGPHVTHHVTTLSHVVTVTVTDVTHFVTL